MAITIRLTILKLILFFINIGVESINKLVVKKRVNAFYLLVKGAI